MALRNQGDIRIAGVLLLSDGRISFQEKTLRLAPRQQSLLLFLARNTDRLVTKEEILEEVWPDAVVEQSSVHQAVKRLRQTLAELRPGVDFIETVPKRGYRLMVEVESESGLPDTTATAKTTSAIPAATPLSGALSPVAQNASALSSRRAWLWGGAGLIAALGAGATVLRGEWIEAESRQLYRDGLALWKTRGYYEVGLALRKFEKSVQLDPEFAAGWVGIANCHLFASAEPPAAEAALRKALALDPACGQAYASLGFLNMVHRWNWAEAQMNFERGVQLSPEDPTAHHWYGVYLSCLRMFESAHPVMRLAQTLDRGSFPIQSDLLRVRFQLQEREAALRGWQELRNQNFAFAANHLVWHLARLDQIDEAVKIWISDVMAEPYRPNLLRVLRAQGPVECIERIIDSLDPFGAAYQVAQWNAVLGRTDRALAALEQAMKSDRFLLFELNLDVAFDKLRGEPAFQAILARVGIPGLISKTGLSRNPALLPKLLSHSR